MTLSDFVKEYRKEHDLSQRQFAAICGLSNGYISMLERNLNPKTGLPLTPSLPALKKISTAMGMSLGDLLTAVLVGVVGIHKLIALINRSAVGYFRGLRK